MCCKGWAMGLLLGGWFAWHTAAQNDLPLVRVWAPEPVLPATFNAEKYRRSGSFFYVQLQQVLNQRGFSSVLGYEQRLSPHWFAGASIIPAVNNNANLLAYSFNLSHTGRFNGWQLLKQATYTLQSEMVRQVGSATRRNYYSAIGFTFGLARNFSIGVHSSLRAVWSYQAVVFPSNSLYPRTIDQTRMQVECAWFPRPHYSIGLFAAQNTSYFIALAQFDANGNMTKPDRRLNLNTGFIGLRLHLLLDWLSVENREQARMLLY
ncbi:MAG: hypothetical protein RMJ87_12120 [Cytophagales bacterium]|nr:hypothetical protein [Bernardetiaceae bacterium]MDW8205767.1 hypothetical protein [Cytophagales bacterium]